jgi:hypothetical protein
MLRLVFLWPAAAVIPAPIAYVKVAAVKKLVVENKILLINNNKNNNNNR